MSRAALQRAGLQPLTARARLDALSGAEVAAWLEDYASGRMTAAECARARGFTSSEWHHWLQERPAIERAWQAARRHRAEVLAEETVPLADDVAEEPEAIAKANLRMKARQWMAGVLDPATFGKEQAQQVNIGQLHLHAVQEINAEDTARRQRALSAQNGP